MLDVYMYDSNGGKYSLQNSCRKKGLAKGLSTQVPTFSTGQSKHTTQCQQLNHLVQT